MSIGYIQIANIPFCFGQYCPDNENFNMQDKGLVSRLFFGVVTGILFTIWYSLAVSVSLSWNTAWTQWLVVKVYLDIVIEILGIILGQDIAIWLVYISTGVFAITIVVNGALLAIQVTSIALMFWTDNGDYVIATALYWYNFVLDKYYGIIAWYEETKAKAEEIWADFV